MRLLTTYTCPSRNDVKMDVQRVIEVWISKVGDAPAEVFYSAHIYMGTRSRHKTLPAIVSSSELMLAQAQAIETLRGLQFAENPTDPIIGELISRWLRCHTRILEGRIQVDEDTGVYDVEDTERITLQMHLATMLSNGSRVARLEISDPDNLR